MSGSRAVRLGPRILVLLDGVVSAAVVLAAGYGTTAATPAGAVAGWLVAVALGLPVAVRRRYPGAALWCGAAATVVALVVGLRPDVAVVATALAAYPAALVVASGRPALRVVLLLGAVPLGGPAALLVPRPMVPDAPAGGPVVTLLYGWLILGATWSLARAVRARRRHAAQVLELRAREAATAERLRVAQEVHDVVGHSLAVIAARAGIANHLAATHPEEGRAALVDVEALSRQALTEVRAVVSASDEPADAPDLAVERLVAGTRGAGVPVELTCTDLSAVPAPVLQAAHRIVQESLTNVVRHTVGPATCRVELAVDDGGLRVEVVDDGPSRSPEGPAGHGLSGIRNRVAQHGGTVVLGPRHTGGFEVRARLPFAGPPARA